MGLYNPILVGHLEEWHGHDESSVLATIIF